MVDRAILLVLKDHGVGMASWMKSFSSFVFVISFGSSAAGSGYLL